MSSNINLPPIEVSVRNKFLFQDVELQNGVTDGFLIGARALQNQALQFNVLLKSGALYTGLPAHALCNDEKAVERFLGDCQMWDNISSNIEYICYDTLKYMSCSVKLKSGDIVTGNYLFSIDAIGSDDLSRHPEHWKMYHMILSHEGNFHLYPQYRIQFTDSALCPNSVDKLPSYSYNSMIWDVGE